MFSSQNSQVSNDAVFVEDVFSTYLYTGNGSTQTITNGIDLSTKGGLVWAKDRDAANSNTLYDTARGVSKTLYSNTTGAQVTEATNEGVYAFGTTGFSIGGGSNTSNGSGNKIASWTFRKQPKFFDVVTWTGNNVNGRVIPHSLDAEVGFIAVKAITTSANDNNWVCRHRSQTSPDRLYLNTTAAASGSTNLAPTTTGFTVYANGYNETGVQYVAYLFAHNAGGFGLTGTDNVISCGSFTTNAGGLVTVNLGYEPQYILYKRTDAVGNWIVADVMRGLEKFTDNYLRPNLSNAEFSQSNLEVTSTGFYWGGGNPSSNYIYIAIRRGPMKVPTSGTSVFKPVTRTGTGTSAYSVTGAGFSPDSIFIRSRNNASGRNWNNFDRLRGIQNDLVFGLTNVETNNSDKVSSYDMGGYSVPATPSATLNASGENFIDYLWKRAPSFMDVVCYTGTGSARTINHNLGVVPELIIEKCRSTASTQGWQVYAASQGASNTAKLNSNAAFGADGNFGAAPTSTVFSINGADHPSGDTFVAYLFATLAGVSKVGSYTGNGSSQTINCGFTGGARFVLIKRTDTTGDWYVWDTARGIVAGNDPYLGLNTYVNEVTTNDTIDTDSTGFVVNQVAATNVNVTSATYIFLAIA